jgi:hypothetical protein
MGETGPMRIKACTDNVAWRVVDGEAVLVHAETSAYFGLNRAGTALWVALAEGAHTPDELVQVLGAENGAGARARQDVDDFLQSLLTAGLVASYENGSEAPPAGAASGSAMGTYEAPALSPFGELEQLILSGE